MNFFASGPILQLFYTSGGYVKTAKTKEKNAFGEENFLSRKTTFFKGKLLEKNDFFSNINVKKKNIIFS